MAEGNHRVLVVDDEPNIVDVICMALGFQGFAVRGAGGLRGGTLEAHGDHRLAMLGAVAGLASAEGVEVIGMEAAAVSYPRFEADLAALLG